MPTLSLALLLFAVPPSAPVQTKAAVPPPTLQGASAPRLVLETLSGGRQVLPLEGLDLTDPRARGAWTVRPEGFEGRSPSERARQQAKTSGHRVQVQMHSGEELRGRVVGGEGEVLSIELLGGVRLPLEVERIRSIVMPERLSTRKLVPLEAPPEGDRLYRRTQAALDAVDGTLDSFSEEGVSFESDEVGLKSFPWDEVAALFIEFLGDENAERVAPKVPVIVDLTDQSRVRGALERMTPTHCQVVVGGHRLSLPWRAVAEVTVVDGRIQFLSDLTPEREEGRGVPFDDDLGMSWPHRMDANVFDGGPLRSGGKSWRRGIGMHAPSKLHFRLEEGFEELVGLCAIDDEALRNPRHARGAVVFRIHLDGELAWESGLVRGGDDPVAMPRLQLAGKKELVLEVDPSGSYAGDRANWLRMILVR